ncbi:hypothetical protein [Herbaspirillum robiniae]|uniref:hypothetical protein n=1 Tax=Herbaspirillum robiniae TaxID=2014887 RepID=UPI00101AD868|nr:hypothetical protein [Herbaspirillum robiniae]
MKNKDLGDKPTELMTAVLENDFLKNKVWPTYVQFLDAIRARYGYSPSATTVEIFFQRVWRDLSPKAGAKPSPPLSFARFARELLSTKAENSPAEQNSGTEYFQPQPIQRHFSALQNEVTESAKLLRTRELLVLARDRWRQSLQIHKAKIQSLEVKHAIQLRVGDELRQKNLRDFNDALVAFSENKLLLVQSYQEDFETLRIALVESERHRKQCAEEAEEWKEKYTLKARQWAHLKVQKESLAFRLRAYEPMLVPDKFKKKET